ncbi:MAG TPA: transposase [Actinomycetota bacterium]|nr:transposase [Actinomycetota bacterium]
MASLSPASPTPLPTDLAALPKLLAFTQHLGLERYLHRPKRGVPTLALALLWLCLAWRGSGRPYHLGHLDEPLLAALIGRHRLPSDQTLYRSLAYFSAKALRRAVEEAYLASRAELSGRVWVAVDTHQVPYWGRGKLDRFQKGWSGSHSRRLRGYRLLLAVDTETGQIITFALARGKVRDQRLIALLARRLRQLLGSQLAGLVADCGFTSKRSLQALRATGVPFILGFARSSPIKGRLAALSSQQRRWLKDGGAVRLGVCSWDERLRLFALGARSPTDKRGPWVYVTTLRSAGPQRLAQTYRQRWRCEQAIEETLNGHDLDHLVSYRLHPNRVAVGFRLLARNLAIGLQIAEAQQRPEIIREPRAFRAEHVDGLGSFVQHGPLLVLTPLRPNGEDCYRLPWTQLVVQLAA